MHSSSLQVDVPHMILLESCSNPAAGGGSAGASEVAEGSPSSHPSHLAGDLHPLSPEGGGQASSRTRGWGGGRGPSLGGGAQRQQVMSER